MLASLKPYLLGIISLLLITVNTVFWCIPFYTVTLVKVLVPHEKFRRKCTEILFAIAKIWSIWLSYLIDLTQKIEWDVAGLEGLKRDSSYLLSANHQSWVDIIVLQYLFIGRIPFPRYFTKQEIIWVPLIGGTLWALEFPFMKRYSKEFLEKHPEMRGKDLETTRKACERYRHMPVTVVNFIEGTRFTTHKHAAQQSPYRWLLRPKAGGLAFVLDAMGENFDSMLDVTIVYPNGVTGFWGLLCGRLSRVVVRITQRSIPGELLGGNYLENPEHREQVQSWVRNLWHEKDTLIENLQQPPVPGPPEAPPLR